MNIIERTRTDKMTVEIVKLQQRSTKGYPVYLVVVPKDIVEELGLKKGDHLAARIVEIDGKRGIFYSKVEA